MTFDRSLANITDYWSVSSRFILPFLSKSVKNALHVITVVKKAILIFLLLSFDAPTAYGYITWNLGIGEEHFLVRLMPFLNIQLDIFNKCHKL